MDVSYGGENGFNQAIDLCGEVLEGVKFIQEKKLIQKYFDEISMDTGKFCFGVDDTIKAMELGAVETLIVWENLDIARFILTNPSTQATKILFLNPVQEKLRSLFVGLDENGAEIELEVTDKTPLVEWFANNYMNYGTTLEFVTDKSQEGAQFVKGFGGIGGLMRYPVEIHHEEDD